MHILIISHGYPTAKDPQWGCFEKDQAEALVKLGHKVTIAAVDGRYRKIDRKHGITHYQDGAINGYVIYYFPLSFLYSYKLILAVRRKMMSSLFKHIVEKEGMPDVVYAHYAVGMYQSAVIKERYNVPVLGIEHWSVLNKPTLSKAERARCGTGYEAIDKLLAVSPSLKTQIKKHFDKDSEVLYDMVNEIFLQQPIVEKTALEPFKFIAVGSLIHRKGFDVLIKALACMKCKSVEVYIVGDGSDKEKLKALAVSEGVADRVRFFGRISKPEIIKLMNECHAFCLPSRDETFGVAHIEAMAMGLPVVTTICGGPEYFVNEANGKLVAIDDVEGLAKAMDDVLQKYDQYKLEEIREYVRSRFSDVVIAKQIIEHIKDIQKK